MDLDQMHVLLRAWETKLRDEGKSAHSVRAYGDSVRALMRWQEQQGTAGLSKAATNGFLAWVIDTSPRGGGASTANLRARAIRQFSAWCMSEGETQADELAGIRPPKPGKRIVPKLSDEELAALIAVCAADHSLYGRRDEALVRLGAEALVRADELLSMDIPADLDLRRGIAIIRRGKGDKGRPVPFGDATGRAIGRYLRTRKAAGLPADGPLWLSQRKGRLSYPGLYSTLGKRARAAGIPDFHPHRLRHTGASRWKAAGGSDTGLMAIGGWTSLDMVIRYTEDSKSELAIDEAKRLRLGEL